MIEPVHLGLMSYENFLFANCIPLPICCRGDPDAIPVLAGLECSRDSQTGGAFYLDVRRNVRAAADCCGHCFQAHAYFLGPCAHSDSLRRMDYRAAMAGFSRDSRGRKTNASVGGANAELTRQNHRSNRWTVIAALGAAAWNHSIVTAA